MKTRITILLPLAAVAALALAGCNEQERPSADARAKQSQEIPDKNIVTGTVPQGNVQTDRDPTPETTTGGDIPKQAEDSGSK